VKSKGEEIKFDQIKFFLLFECKWSAVFPC